MEWGFELSLQSLPCNYYRFLPQRRKDEKKWLFLPRIIFTQFSSWLWIHFVCDSDYCGKGRKKLCEGSVECVWTIPLHLKPSFTLISSLRQPSPACEAWEPDRERGQACLPHSTEPRTLYRPGKQVMGGDAKPAQTPLNSNRGVTTLKLRGYHFPHHPAS